MSKSFRSNLSRARGIGPAKSGAKSWLSLRVGAVALIPVCVWFLYSAIQLAATGLGHDIVVVWVKTPLNAFMLLMLIGLSAHHGFLGTKEIIEDYVPDAGMKHICVIAKQIGFLFLAAASAFAVLSIYFKG